jgi:D-alanyl-D-alanine carboxypeptidase (penicillin-binding protein 5/6)
VPESRVGAVPRQVLRAFSVPGWFVAGLALCLFSAGAHAATLRDLGQVSAKAAVVIDDHTGEVLFARNPNLRLPPASTTKLLTAMVALEHGELRRSIPVSRYAATMQPSKIWLGAGWVMNLEDLLYATLLNSANDASVVVAEGVAGSVPEFSRLMNATARSFGAEHSNFVNPNGLPDADHYSTVFDLAKIMHHAARNPRLRAILNTQNKIIRPQRGSNRQIQLRSHNRLLYRKDVPVIGKTGYTRKAKRCFTGLASDGQREVIVAMLGSDRLWPDLERLVDYGMARASLPSGMPSQSGWQQASSRIAPTVEDRTEPVDQRTNPEAWEKAVVRAGRDLASWEKTSRARAAAPPKQAATDRRDDRFSYHVQLATFRSRSEADRLRRQAARHGYSAAIESAQQSGRVSYRVTVRGFATRDSARRAARMLGNRLSIEPLIFAAKI